MLYPTYSSEIIPCSFVSNFLMKHSKFSKALSSECDSLVNANASVSQATDFITLGLGEFSYLQTSTFAKHRQEIRKNVVKLSDILSNKLINFMSQLDNKNHYDIIVSGGGIMIPEMKESLERKIQRKIEIPKIPIMSNAIGLYKLAANK